MPSLSTLQTHEPAVARTRPHCALTVMLCNQHLLFDSGNGPNIIQSESTMTQSLQPCSIRSVKALDHELLGSSHCNAGLQDAEYCDTVRRLQPKTDSGGVVKGIKTVNSAMTAAANLILYATCHFFTATSIQSPKNLPISSSRSPDRLTKMQMPVQLSLQPHVAHDVEHGPAIVFALANVHEGSTEPARRIIPAQTRVGCSAPPSD